MNEQLDQKIKMAVKVLKSAGAREVYLFGSAASDSMNPDSDIDFAVKGLPEEVFYRSAGELLCLLDRPIDLIDLDEGYPFGEYLQRKGKLRRVA